MNQNISDVERFARQLIKFHGFYSNEETGFSCYIPDQYPFSKKEGLLLWVFSHRHRRIETQLQKFHTFERINRMQKMLGISHKDYKEEISIAINQYIHLLRRVGCFEEIGEGINLFDSELIWNYAADIELLTRHPEYLKEIEKITIENPIVQFAIDWHYFRIKNKDQLIWDNFWG